MKTRTDKILAGVFLASMTIYVVMFAACFAQLPINPSPWHQVLLLYFHGIPMFCLQLLLCRTAKLRWRLVTPFLLLAVPGLVFVSAAGWHVLGWFLFLWWCVSPVMGCALAWGVYGWCRRKGEIRRV